MDESLWQRLRTGKGVGSASANEAFDWGYISGKVSSATKVSEGELGEAERELVKDTGSSSVFIWTKEDVEDEAEDDSECCKGGTGCGAVRGDDGRDGRTVALGDRVGDKAPQDLERRALWVGRIG
ncbi:hypothetical protein C0992_004593 [Termitomyces sp. T32_za158]|nr:hypothetical protein C0992_004593 [Termitomyces sp. T32_za158]